ncbi:hypothetical protein D3C76_1604270 [compost metagenome]
MAPQNRFSLCSSEPRTGQNSLVPNTAMKNGTTVTNAKSITAMPTATATAERYNMNCDKPIVEKPTRTASPEKNTVFPALRYVWTIASHWSSVCCSSSLKRLISKMQ